MPARRERQPEDRQPPTPVAFTVRIDGETIAARTTLNQCNWGIKRYSAFLGALKVDEFVGVEMHADASRPITTLRHAQDDAVAPGSPSSSALQHGEQCLSGGDVDGARAAFEQAQAEGDVRGSLKLAALLEDHRKDLSAAEAAWRQADDAGDLNGAGNLGRLLREKGDLRGAEAAFRRSADRGSLRAASTMPRWSGCALHRRRRSSTLPRCCVPPRTITSGRATGC